MDKAAKSLHTSKSFTRLESVPQSPQARSRASTIQGPPVPNILFTPNTTHSADEEDGKAGRDIFATKEVEEDEIKTGVPESAVPDTFEELPIEIRSLTERFLESLSAKVHPSPLSADALSDLFQDFYTRASSHVSTHIATLAYRLSRQASTATVIKPHTASTRANTLPLVSRKASDDSGNEQQMLTASEVADRKKARRLLEVKRTALEEAVERAVCEKVYDKIWRHRSTDDEERDHKLRSRTAALSLVGIGLKELLMTAEELTEEAKQKTKEREGEIREWLSTARSDIQKMDEERYPLGKLRHLTTAHKSIVEALSKIFPASSSADEILPTLIYTLITSSPESLNVVSNLKFIHRFRGSSRVDGETAYCLVNLEAAISFLETVDLSSLRAEEALDRPITPKSQVTPMKLGLAEAPDLTQTSTMVASGELGGKRPPSPTTKAQRRLSSLIQTQTNRIEAAGDAVKESIMESADQALDTIHNTLDNSFKFLFGRLKEQQPGSPLKREPSLPKTLEEARKLVSSPHLATVEDENASVSATSSLFGDEQHEGQDLKDSNSKVTDLFGGRRPIRDRSVDSTQSRGSGNGSGKRVGFTETKTPSTTRAESASPLPSPATSAVESMRNLGNTLNPLNRFASMNMIPRFGRTVSSASTPPATEAKPPTPPPNSRSVSAAHIPPRQEEEKVTKASAALEFLRKTSPPVKRFVDLKDAKDLKISEVEELLKEYQRLAGALKQAINS
ncbi:hypothetical protein GQ43DRAFT_390103 [Delitschia confertaspora ATCC 74209]|uniref:VPS9 domain-containing protein n=1 Tax=Delitschia confertaspora ATCC 74209 TaxID=1513339 RepID=A0A9P4MU89_9PLEO|nr:hypothetical protein GQ43DRAFT_390103 [Delitschia confertaspora ATCC 74209]